MNDKTKIIGALVIGAIAGAALVKLIESEKGQKFVDKAKEKAKNTANDIKNKISELENELAELIKEKQDINNQA